MRVVHLQLGRVLAHLFDEHRLTGDGGVERTWRSNEFGSFGRVWGCPEGFPVGRDLINGAARTSKRARKTTPIPTPARGCERFSRDLIARITGIIFKVGAWELGGCAVADWRVQ